MGPACPSSAPRSRSRRGRSKGDPTSPAATYAAAATALTAGLAAATASSATAAPSTASITGIPTSCVAFSTYLEPDRSYGVLQLEDSRVGYYYPSSESGRLSYQPIAYVNRSSRRTATTATFFGYSVSPGGTVHHVVRTWSDTDRMTTRRTVVQSGWGQARAMAAGQDVLYVVIGDRLRRYTVTSTGALREGTTLATGFSNVQTLSAGGCATGTALLGVSASGRIYAYWDCDGVSKDGYQAAGRLATRQVMDVPTYSN